MKIFQLCVVSFSVIEITRSTFSLGETVNLYLMRREKNSLFATPVKSAIQPPTTFLSVSENAGNHIYSKLLIANVKDVSLYKTLLYYVYYIQE